MIKKRPFSGIWKINILVISLILIIFIIIFFVQMKTAQKRFSSHVLNDAKIMGRLIEENIHNAILSESGIEETIKSLLANSAEFAAYLDEVVPFSNEELKAYAENAGLEGIYIKRSDSKSMGPKNWVKIKEIESILIENSEFKYLKENKLYIYILKAKNSFVAIGLKSEKINELKEHISSKYLIEKLKTLPGIIDVELQKIKNENKEHISVIIDDKKKIARAAIKLNSSILLIDFDSTPYFARLSEIKKEFFIFFTAIIFSGVFFSWVLIKIQGFHIKRVMEFERNLSKEKEDALMGRAAGTIAHEIKNPVNTISMGLQRLLHESKNLQDEKKELILILIKSSKRIASITDNLRNYTRPFKPEVSNFNLANLLKEILKIYKDQFAQKNIIPELNESIFNINADKELIFTLCDNIIKNALEAVEYNGDLKIELKRDEKKIFINFINTLEKQIKPKDLIHFKEPYYTSKFKGTGLGLAICEKIASAHNGSLDLNIKNNRFQAVFCFKDTNR